MTPCEIVQNLMPNIRATSELKVLLAIASVTSTRKASALSLTDLMKLTGLSKQGVISGLELAMKRGVLKRQECKNSFAYWLEPVSEVDTSASETVNTTDRNGQDFRPLPVNEVDRFDSKSSHEVDRFETLAHIPDLKERTYARAETISRFQKLVGLHDTEWLDRRDFNFEQALDVWGETLGELWRRCLKAPNSKPGEKPIWRFQDACERTRDLGLNPPQERSGMVAGGGVVPHLSPGDQARTPDGRARTILDVCSNGMVVFEDDSVPYHLKYLEPVVGVYN